MPDFLFNPIIGGIIVFVLFFGFFWWKTDLKTASIIMGAMIILGLGVMGGFFGIWLW